MEANDGGHGPETARLHVETISGGVIPVNKLLFYEALRRILETQVDQAKVEFPVG